MPFAPSESKIARIETMDAWLRHAEHPDFGDQDANTRVPIEIGAFTTFWCKGLVPTSPPFLVTANQGVRYLLVYIERGKAIAVYENCGKTWTRRALLTAPTEMLAVLPQRAFQADLESKPASEKQIVTLKKFLDAAADRKFPELSARACSRLLDRLIVERALAKLKDDIAACAAEVDGPTLARD